MLWLPIDRSSNLPLIHQVYQQIHDRILSGELKAGQRLPATRELAASLQVSRNVVLQAYDQLLAEGYIEGRQGSGTYVAPGTYLEQAPAEPPTSSFELTHIPEATETAIIDFRSGVPALEHFPRKLWAQLTKRVCETTPNSLLGYGVPEG